MEFVLQRVRKFWFIWYSEMSETYFAMDYFATDTQILIILYIIFLILYPNTGIRLEKMTLGRACKIHSRTDTLPFEHVLQVKLAVLGGSTSFLTSCIRSCLNLQPPAGQFQGFIC